MIENNENKQNSEEALCWFIEVHPSYKA